MRESTVVFVASAINDAVILKKTTVEIEEGETVYDILVQIARQESITLNVNGNSVTGGVYVRSISSLGEFDNGDLSGWVYLVNGERASVGCDNYKLSPNDEICWFYSLNLGEDAAGKEG